MNEASCCTLTVLDVADALQSNYAFISGGKSRRSFPIITFPECPTAATFSDDQHRNVMRYLMTVPPRNEIELGFVIIIDRRQDKWASLKTVLIRIVDHNPDILVQKIYVLQPSSFLQKPFADTSLRFLRDDVKFKILVLSTTDELHNHIDKDQLTPDLGGTLLYNHEEWIQHRAALEKFRMNVQQIADTLSQLSIRLQETEFPNDVAQTEALIADNAVAKQEVVEDLNSTVHHGEALRDSFTAVIEADNSGLGQLPQSRFANIDAVEKILNDLSGTTANFEKFWARHERRLDQCLQLRKFEEQFKHLQFSCERHLEALTSMTDIGDTLLKATSLLAAFKDFENNSKDDISCAERLRTFGEKFMEADHYAVDCIKPKCAELERICTEYKAMFTKRQSLLQSSKDLHEKIEKANKWCARGIDLMANPETEQCDNEAVAQDALNVIDKFLEEASEFKLDNPVEFHQHYDSVLVPEIMETVKDVLSRLEDVQTICKNRRDNLCRFLKKPIKPAKKLTLEVTAPVSKSSTSPSPRENADEENKKRRPTLKTRKLSLVRSSSKSTFYETSLLENGVVVNGFGSQAEEITGETRSGVMQDLVNTEKIYIDELNSIVQGYMLQMDEPEMAKLLPPRLHGKKDILFGNLHEIYNFHANVFLKDLQECCDTPTLVGTCFMARKSEFQMYSKYCENTLLSEELRKKSGDQNLFFKECQQKLGHQLPLAAYLLKPIERIKCYQCLLKEMLKYSEGDEGAVELKESLDTLQSIINHVTDIMAQISITGFEGNLADQGQLLMQGSFTVWSECKKERLRDLRRKPMNRHIFLFERVIIFCKKKEDPQGIDKTVYVFKGSLKTSAVGLTENIKTDKRKFEVWLADKSEKYIVQAVSPEVKNAWVIEIRKVLQNQFKRMRERSRKNSTSSAGKLLSPDGDVDSDSSSLGNNGEASPTVAPWQRANISWSSPTRDGVPNNHEPDGRDEVFNNNSGPFMNANGKKLISASLFDLRELHVTAHYVAIGNYVASYPDELTIHEGEELELLNVGSDSRWQVKSTVSGQVGWVPARYLEASQQCSNYSLQSIQSTPPTARSMKMANESMTVSQLSLYH